jgi:hypothetical protein
MSGRLIRTRLEVTAGQEWTGRQVQIEGRVIRIETVSGETVTYTVLAKATYRSAGPRVGRMRIASLRSAYRLTSAA